MASLTSRQQRVKEKLAKPSRPLNSRDLEVIAPLLDSDDAGIRREVVVNLEIDPDVDPEHVLELRKRLIGKVNDPDVIVRRGAVELLGWTLAWMLDRDECDLRSLDVLVDAATMDDSRRVRRCGVSVLGRLVATAPDTLPVDDLREEFLELVDDEPVVAAVAIQALGHVGAHTDDAASRDILTDELFAPDRWTRVGALRGLGVVGIADPRLVDGFVDEILTLVSGADDEVVREEAIATLDCWLAQTGLDDERVHSEIAGGLSARSRKRRRRAAIATARLADSRIAWTENEVDSLVSMVLTGDDELARPATRALREITVERPELVENAVAELVDALDDRASGKWAAKALGEIGAEQPRLVGDSVGRLVEILHDRESGSWAARAIGEIGAEQPGEVDNVVENLIGALDDEDIRKSAARTLWEIGKERPELIEDAVPRLIDALDDERDEEVRGWVTRLIGEIGARKPGLVGEAVPSLVEALDDDNWNARYGAAEALGKIGQRRPRLVEGAIPSLIDALDEDGESQAAKALGKIGGERPALVETAIPTLTAALDDDRIVGGWAARALGEIGSQRPDLIENEGAVSNLVDALDEEGESQAAKALGKIGSRRPGLVEDAVPDLIDALEDEDVRSSASRALGQIGSERLGLVESALPSLVALLRDGSSKETEEAAIALARLGWDPTLWARAAGVGPDGSVAVAEALEDVTATSPGWVRPLCPELRESLNSDSPELRAAACRTLGHLGDARSRSRLNALKDADERIVREAAREALDRLGNESHDFGGIPSTVRSEDERVASPDLEFRSWPAPERVKPDPDTVSSPPSASLDFDDIDIDGLIGEGENAQVYRASTTIDELPRTIAVKLPPEKGTLSNKLMEEMVDEARTWKTLDNHDHIVGILDWGDDGVPWIAMEYMDGGSLRDRLDTEGQLQVREALWIGRCLVEAVKHSHYEHTIVHLDLKPANVLLRETPGGTWPVPKVGDWGLARRLIEHSPVEERTPGYAAPEQIDPGSPIPPGNYTDIYQIGVVIYEMLTGELPYDARGPELPDQLADPDVEPIPPSERRPELSREVDEVLLKALAYDKDDRYETIVNFQKGLEALQGEEPLPAFVATRLNGDSESG